MKFVAELGHAAFAATDVEASLAFYAALGIHEAFRLNHEDGALMLIYLHIAGDRFLEIFPGGSRADPAPEGSFKHLCLLTENLYETVASLRDTGISIDCEPSRGFTTNLQAWIKDPDGNVIELMELNPGSLQWRAGRGNVIEKAALPDDA
jgi:lactoylglutathione lyase